MWMFQAALATPRLRRRAGGTLRPKSVAAPFPDSAADSAGELSESGPPASPARRTVFAVLLVSPLRAAAAAAAGVAVGWLTRWPVMGFFFFTATAAMPWLSTKNSRRQKNIAAAETVEKLTDSIVALVSDGRKVEQATELALSSPTVEFQEAAVAIQAKMASSFSAGLEELRKRVDHSLGDILASTLHFVSASEAAGRPGEALQGISNAAADNAAMERRIMVRQREGYTSAKIALWATLLIMLFQAVVTRENYAVYDPAAGQLLLLGIGMIMTLGVWLTLIISRGRNTLRIDFPLER